MTVTLFLYFLIIKIRFIKKHRNIYIYIYIYIIAYVPIWSFEHAKVEKIYGPFNTHPAVWPI